MIARLTCSPFASLMFQFICNYEIKYNSIRGHGLICTNNALAVCLNPKHIYIFQLTLLNNSLFRIALLYGRKKTKSGWVFAHFTKFKVQHALHDGSLSFNSNSSGIVLLKMFTSLCAINLLNDRAFQRKIRRMDKLNIKYNPWWKKWIRSKKGLVSSCLADLGSIR